MCGSLASQLAGEMVTALENNDGPAFGETLLMAVISGVTPSQVDGALRSEHGTNLKEVEAKAFALCQDQLKHTGEVRRRVQENDEYASTRSAAFAFDSY